MSGLREEESPSKKNGCLQAGVMPVSGRREKLFHCFDKILIVGKSKSRLPTYGPGIDGFKGREDNGEEIKCHGMVWIYRQPLRDLLYLRRLQMTWTSDEKQND